MREKEEEDKLSPLSIPFADPLLSGMGKNGLSKFMSKRFLFILGSSRVFAGAFPRTASGEKIATILNRL